MIDKIIAYETGELNDIESVKLFSELVTNGIVWTLQCHYGITAKALIDNNIIDTKGNILIEL